MSDNRLRSLDFLDGLPFLLHLNASRNLLAQLRFSAPRQLQTVDFSFNLLGELPNFEVNKYVQKLSLNGNFLEFVPPGIAMSRHLRVLDLSNNSLTSLVGIGLLDLVELYASGNQLTSLDGIEALGELRVLSVQGNQLRHVPLSPERHPLLMRLDARDNLLAHRDRISELPKFPYLSDLYLSPNPLDQLPQYRAQMLHRIRHLRWLDDAAVTAEEKVKADVIFELEVPEREAIHSAVLPREAFLDRRHVKSKDLEETEMQMFGQVGGFYDNAEDVVEAC